VKKPLSDKNLERVLLLKLVTLTFITFSTIKLISKATIDTVFETARVEEVIGDFVQLKRAGSNFKVKSFSDERSPSFMVSPAKEFGRILVVVRVVILLLF
jgi:hypothetical protein